MSSWSNINVSDFGWVGKMRIVQDDIAVDISSYTTKQFILKPPTGSLLTKTASFDSDGTDGILKYTFLTGDIVLAGDWHVQARIAKTGVEITSEPLLFTVGERLS